MKNDIVMRWLCIGAVSWASSCGGQTDAPLEFGTAQEALTTIPQAGFIPYPIRFDLDRSSPNHAPDGSEVPAWDGSVTDLVAADAFAQCVATSALSKIQPTMSRGGNDAYLNRLIGLMDQFDCKPAGTRFDAADVDGDGNVTEALRAKELHWLEKRKQPECNVDGSGSPAKVEGIARDVAPYDALYTSQWGLTGIYIAVGRQNAGKELEYADVNLCMAQQLRSQLNSGQSLFLSTSDQAELYGVMTERAKLAVVYYSLLAKVLTADTTGMPTSLTAAENQWLLIVRKWAEQVGVEKLTRVGEDYALAIKLLAETTLEFGRFSERLASARPVGASGARSDRDWGVGQPRARLMNLIYGGDPIGGTSAQPEPGRGLGGVDNNGKVRPYVKQSMADAQVSTLLGLARSTDALFFKMKGNPNSPTPTCSQPPCEGFDVDASADMIYRRIEAGMSAQECERLLGGPACDVEAILAGLPQPLVVENTQAWKKYKIEPSHARTLAAVFNDAFGEIVNFSFSNTSDLFGAFHLFGQHCTQQLEGASWIHVDPQFNIAPYAGRELGYYFEPTTELPEKLVLDASPKHQGFDAGPNGDSGWETTRKLGVLPALSFAREALLEGANAAAPLSSFFLSAGSAYLELERLVGVRSVALRRTATVASVACNTSPINMSLYGAAATCKYVTYASSPAEISIKVATAPQDTLDTLALADDARQVRTLAFDPRSVTYQGNDRSALDWAPTSGYSVSPQTLGSSSSFVSGREFRRFVTPYNGGAPYPKQLMLKGKDDDGAEVYWAMHSNSLTGTKFFSEGGLLNQLAERAFAVSSSDWSRPVQDAFGFPTDWIPPADASLVGGLPGEPAYRYYLQAAKDAANKATTAVKEAIDNVVDQERNNVQLAAADERARSVVELENRAFCGSAAGCSIELQVWDPGEDWEDCGNDVSVPSSWCRAAHSMLYPILPMTFISKDVRSAMNSPSATFNKYSGSLFQRNFNRQLAAVEAIRSGQKAYFDTAKAIAQQELTAASETAAAATEFNTAKTAYEAQWTQVEVGVGTEQENLVKQYLDNSAALAAEVAAAKQAANSQCSFEAFELAYESGLSWNEQRDLKLWFEATEDGTIPTDELGILGTITVEASSIESKSYSMGPLFAQIQACQTARNAYGVAVSNQSQLEAAYQASKTDLNNWLLEGKDSQTKAIMAARDAAYDGCRARMEAKEEAKLQVVEAGYAQLSSAVLQLQTQFAELRAALAELDQGREGIKLTAARQDMETELARVDASTRHGVRRKYRSYDLWRAKALLESARRLAVAARRSIEAHFVVDLSDIAAPQAFVDSPSVWADDIYADDLNAPSVVGLSAAPQVEGALYPNKLIDYVDNLERFVQGYTITYPTAIASPDTEVITLPGPELIYTVEDPSEQDPARTSLLLDPDSGVWSFYCTDSESWVANPGYGATRLQKKLDVLCGGKAPTRARIRFQLDPWGGLNRPYLAAPYDKRHNVRWRTLAVNLVGTGVRDCEAAPDRSACYSEAFVRYDLRHYGAAWLTNHSHEWRAYDLPEGFIEGGKALAVEEWLDPVNNSWDLGFVSNVARSELSGRPVSGDYELILELTPDVRLDRIERVQLLTGVDYWVRQE